MSGSSADATAPRGLRAWRPATLRGQLLLGILVPVLLLVLINTASLYRQALHAADTAYDRTLLASAKTIGEQLEVSGSDAAARLIALPYSALEAFEADNRSRMYYKVTGFAGEVVSGFADIPSWRGRLPVKGPYAALVDFYDDVYRGQAVRVAVLLQPVASTEGRGVATIQVAETLELRETLARQILVATLWRQAVLILVIVLVVGFVVQHATRPVRALSEEMRGRSDNDLGPLGAPDAPRELQPLVDATNQVMARLGHLLEHQKRFVRDTSHQLRTPLAVLKTQLQSALRGDVEPQQALVEMSQTVARATELANQMLALAKVEQLRQQGDAPASDLAAAARSVALDLAPLIAEHQLDFSIETVPSPVRGHEWALRELVRNLLHNAIKAAPEGTRLQLAVAHESGQAVLSVTDEGPGLSDAQRLRLFEPFATGAAAGSNGAGHGSGLGLAICHEIVRTLSGTIALNNRVHIGRVAGLDAVVRLALATPAMVENSAR